MISNRDNTIDSVEILSRIEELEDEIRDALEVTILSRDDPVRHGVAQRGHAGAGAADLSLRGLVGRCFGTGQNWSRRVFRPRLWWTMVKKMAMIFPNMCC